jgi:hypothetical protein
MYKNEFDSNCIIRCNAVIILWPQAILKLCLFLKAYSLEGFAIFQMAVIMNNELLVQSRLRIKIAKCTIPNNCLNNVSLIMFNY